MTKIKADAESNELIKHKIKNKKRKSNIDDDKSNLNEVKDVSNQGETEQPKSKLPKKKSTKYFTESADNSEHVKIQKSKQEKHPDVELIDSAKTSKMDKKKEKRLKKSLKSDDANDDDESSDDEKNRFDDEFMLRQPTREELRESEKPENLNAIVTKRQKKKQKKEQRLQEQKGVSVVKEKQKNEEYILKWKNARNEWKFEKIRQIWIQQSIYDENKISKEIWPIALEYLDGTKGQARQKMLSYAEEIISNLDKESEEKSDDAERLAIIESTKYQRAREMLQAMNAASQD